MEELIQKVSEKAGISTEQAKSAIETLLAHFKDKLPFGIGDKLESYVQGGSESSSSPEGFFGELKDKIGGMF